VGRYSVRVQRSAAREIEAVPRKDRERIIERIRTLSEDPRPPGSKKLSGREAYRIRQGDYRVVYTVNAENRLVMVSVVAHRGEVYR
jgi:mRNA interferase RelE/StbE